MQKRGGWGRNRGDFLERIALVTSIVNVVRSNPGITGTSTNLNRILPVERVGVGTLIAKRIGGQCWAIQQIERQVGRAGAGGIAGAGALDLREVDQQACLGPNLLVGIRTHRFHAVAIAAVRRENATGYAISRKGVGTQIGVHIRTWPRNRHRRNNVERPVRTAPRPVYPVGLIVVAPGRSGLPA